MCHNGFRTAMGLCVQLSGTRKKKQNAAAKKNPERVCLYLSIMSECYLSYNDALSGTCYVNASMCDAFAICHTSSR